MALPVFADAAAKGLRAGLLLEAALTRRSGCIRVKAAATFAGAIDHNIFPAHGTVTDATSEVGLTVARQITR